MSEIPMSDREKLVEDLADRVILEINETPPTEREDDGRALLYTLEESTIRQAVEIAAADLLHTDEPPRAEEEVMQCMNCGEPFDWKDDVQSAYHEGACTEVEYPEIRRKIAARLRSGDGERYPLFVTGCVRCGTDHEITFQPLAESMGQPAYNYVGWCERGRGPVAMRVVPGIGSSVQPEGEEEGPLPHHTGAEMALRMARDTTTPEGEDR